MKCHLQPLSEFTASLPPLQQGDYIKIEPPSRKAVRLKCFCLC